MNLGMDFRGGLERLPALLENLVARINTVWKKQHNTAGGHTTLTATSVTTGGLTVGDDQYPGPGVWTGSLTMPAPVFIVAPADPANEGGQIVALSRQRIRVHSDEGLTLEGSLISIAAESDTVPGTQGASIQMGGIPGVTISSPTSVTVLANNGSAHITADTSARLQGSTTTVELIAGTDIDQLAGNDINLDAGNSVVVVAAGVISLDPTGGTGDPIVVLVKGQLNFPATQNPSSDANTLDDYEEGSYTPASSTITYATAQGNYTKVGRLVHVAITLVFPVTASGAQADVTLPFTPGAAANIAGCWPWNASVANVVIGNTGGTNLAQFLTPGGGGVSNNTMSGATFRCSYTYETD